MILNTRAFFYESVLPDFQKRPNAMSIQKPAISMLPDIVIVIAKTTNITPTVPANLDSIFLLLKVS